MVTVQDQNIDKSYIQSIKHLTIPVSEMTSSTGIRLDASVYCTDGRTARLKIEALGTKVTSLNPDDGFVSECLYPNRFKRIYVDQEHGLDFLLPSQISETFPKPSKYISPKTEVDVDELKVKKNSILLTRSGTIGKLTLVSETISNKIFSDDVIRVSFNEVANSGYTYAFLKSETGQSILTTNNYGAVVQHIEPSHLADIKIPCPPPELKKRIHDLIIQSFSLRDESNQLIQKAQSILINELKLPKIHTLPKDTFGSNADVDAYTVSASALNNRLDASYHVPIVDSIESHIRKYAKEIVYLGDDKVSEEIILPGRFKRIYVEENNGIPFFGGKQIHELVPSNLKFLSRVHHSKRIKQQLELKENMVLVTCSGTIGKVAIVPKHWEGWAANQHIMRIIARSDKLAGYIYAWLDTDYGQALITKHTYGAVVDEIDDQQLSSVPIPLLVDDIQSKINNLVIEANRKRYEAFLLEKEAISIIDNDILGEIA